MRELEHSEKEFSRLAKEVRFRRFNRVDRPKGIEDMKDEAMAKYRQFANKERNEMKQAGFKGNAIREGPIQMLGAERYWLIISELRRDPLLRGPDGENFTETNTWAQWFVKHIEGLNETIGEVKNFWSCCRCGELYRSGDPTAFLFGIQVGDNPATDIVWYVAHPPMGTDQDLMNLIKANNALRAGVLIPKNSKRRARTVECQHLRMSCAP